MSLRELRYKFLSRFGRKEIREHYKYKLGVIEQTKLENNSKELSEKQTISEEKSEVNNAELHNKPEEKSEVNNTELLNKQQEMLKKFESINQKLLNDLTTMGKKIDSIQYQMGTFSQKQLDIEHQLKHRSPYLINQDSSKKMVTSLLMDEYVEQIKALKLFDEDYYVSRYPEYKKYGLSPLDHYIKLGWKMHYNPSESFDTKFYLSMRPKLDECPLIHFLREGRYVAVYGYVSNPFPEDSLKEPDKKKNKVVYTCIVGDYDALVQQAYVDEEYDYICFSDNKEWLEKGQIGIWKIRPLVISDLDTTRINRYHKINPHIVLSEYEESIYIDSNVNILTPFLFDLVKARNLNLLLPRHFLEVCPYAHSKWILRDNVDYPELVNAFIDLMKKAGFPINYGMTENNIIYRKHHEPSVIKMMDEWWSYIRDYCKRDQLSFSFVLWKNGISVDDISFPNARSDIENFMLLKHQKRRPDVK